MNPRPCPVCGRVSRCRCRLVSLAAALALALAIAQPAAAQFFGGGGAGGATVTWGLCTQAPCAVGTDLTNHWIVPRGLKPKLCYASFKVAPQGSAFVLDIKREGTSIFTAGNWTIAAGSRKAQAAAFVAGKWNGGEDVSVDISQVGSTTPGQALTVTCNLR